MFKETLYNLVVEKLNTVAEDNGIDLKFAGGYDIIYYQNQVPQAVFTSTESVFDYKKQTVIPVAEEYNQETPFFDKPDRSDYVCQYQLMFRLKDLDNVKIVLEELRKYFYENKYHNIEDYNVTFKTTRGSKQATYKFSAGTFMGRYKLDVMIIASKGYLVKDTDKWQIREHGTSTYKEILTIDDLAGTTYNSKPSIQDEKMTNYNTVGSFTAKFRIPYNDNAETNALEELIYSQAMNKNANPNTLFDLKETLNNVEREYLVIINDGSRTKKLNEPLFIEFNVVER